MVVIMVQSFLGNITQSSVQQKQNGILLESCRVVLSLCEKCRMKSFNDGLMMPGVSTLNPF